MVLVRAARGSGCVLMIYLLTTTGMRPEAWSLCKHWMRGQSYIGPVTWVIVDDGEEVMDLSGIPSWWIVVHVTPKPKWKRGQNTQTRNLRAGLNAVPDDAKLLVIEDDDYYAPGYLTAAVDWLSQADLVGECNSRYYNVHTRRWAYCNNRNHCSLMSTAMKGKALETFREVVQGKQNFVDLELWKRYRGKKLISETTLTVGIKGLPGRPGIGAGHRLTSGAVDRDGRTLRNWIGKDAEVYLCEMG